MSDTPEDATELYENALAVLGAGVRRREENFPQLEALRRQYHDSFDRPSEDDEKRIIVDMVIRDVQALFDDEKEDPVDPDNWLPHTYEVDNPGGRR